MEKKYTKSTLELASSMILSEQPISGKDLLSQEKAKKAKGGKTIAQSMQSMTNDDLLPSPEEITRFFSAHKHEILGAAAIAAFLIPPPVGPLISAGISGADAALYWNEGDKYTGGFMAMLSVLPFLGIATKIPGLAQLGAAGTKALASKLAQIQKGLKPVLTKVEQEIVKAIGTNKAIIAKQTVAYLKKKAAKIAASKAGKVAKTGTKTIGTTVAAKTIWDPIYTKYGFDVAEMEARTLPLFRKIKQLALQESKNPTLDSIIIEESYKLNEAWVDSKPTTTKPTVPTKQSVTGKQRTEFYKWITSPDQIYWATKFDIKSNTPITSPKIDKAFKDPKITQEWGAHYVSQGKTTTGGEIKTPEADSNVWTKGSDFVTQHPLITSAVLLGAYALYKGRKARLAAPVATTAVTNPKLVAQMVSWLKVTARTKGGLAKALRKNMTRLNISNEEVDEIGKVLGDDEGRIATSLAIQWRTIAIEDFIKNGGKPPGVLAADLIGMMTEKERQLWAPYVTRYAKKFK